jgi:hypothetical protein
MSIAPHPMQASGSTAQIASRKSSRHTTSRENPLDEFGHRPTMGLNI